jgi:hypothetical protein
MQNQLKSNSKLVPRTTCYYDWHKDLEPEILLHLNNLLHERGIEPVKSLHGGYLKDGKWVNEHQETYVNFWHAYLDCWGDDVRNDSFALTHFAGDDEGWARIRKYVDESRSSVAVLVVDAVRKTIEQNDFPRDWCDELEPVLIWFSW